MPARIILLRGINLGPANRIVMPRLRELLAGAGLEEPRTYLQSGNVVASSGRSPSAIERLTEALIERELGLGIDVVVRTREELAELVRANPMPEAAADPKRFQVSFLSAPLPADRVAKLEGLVTGSEQLVAHGRELYAWHPNGVGRSKLAAALAARNLGVKATARNWATVTALLAMAGES